jgi:hypothetical protein
LTFLSNGKFTTQAATDQAAVEADILQYRIGAGPAVDAVHDGGVYVTGDVAADPRWGEWGRRVRAEVVFCRFDLGPRGRRLAAEPGDRARGGMPAKTRPRPSPCRDPCRP